MDDLIAFLRARLDDDEQTARAASDGWYGYDPEQSIAFVPVEDTQHIARHSPARVLAEVNAKRQLIDRYGRAFENRRAHPDDLASAGALLALHGAVKLLALPYADHPDYQDTWRP